MRLSDLDARLRDARVREVGAGPEGEVQFSLAAGGGEVILRVTGVVEVWGPKGRDCGSVMSK